MYLCIKFTIQQIGRKEFELLCLLLYPFIDPPSLNVPKPMDCKKI